MYVIVSPPPVGEQNIVMSMSVSLSVHKHISETTCPNFTKFLVHVTFAIAWSFSDGSAIHYVLTSFVDDVMFSYYGLRWTAYQHVLFNYHIAGSLQRHVWLTPLLHSIGCILS